MRRLIRVAEFLSKSARKTLFQPRQQLLLQDPTQFRSNGAEFQTTLGLFSPPDCRGNNQPELRTRRVKCNPTSVPENIGAAFTIAIPP